MPKLASKFVKVVLSGIGGDELFAGYPWRYFRMIIMKWQYIDNYYNIGRDLFQTLILNAIFSIFNDIKNVWTKDIFSSI